MNDINININIRLNVEKSIDVNKQGKEIIVFQRRLSCTCGEKIKFTINRNITNDRI